MTTLRDQAFCCEDLAEDLAFYASEVDRIGARVGYVLGADCPERDTAESLRLALCALSRQATYLAGRLHGREAAALGQPLVEDPHA